MQYGHHKIPYVWCAKSTIQRTHVLYYICQYSSFMPLKSMFSTPLSLQTVVLVALIPIELLAIILQIVGLVECKQCLLFANIYEVERILEGGFIGWCYVLILRGLLLIFGCIVLLSRRPIMGIAFNRLIRVLT